MLGVGLLCAALYWYFYHAKAGRLAAAKMAARKATATPDPDAAAQLHGDAAPQSGGLAIRNPVIAARV